MALITCDDVTLGYDGETVLTDINFKIESGDYLCVVGENGAGKSTLIKGLLKLINPMSGSISMSDGLRVSEIGYLPQQTAIQRNFPASIFEVVLSGTLWDYVLFTRKSRRGRRLIRLILWGLQDLKNGAIRSFPEGSSRGCFWQGRSAPRAG